MPHLPSDDHSPIRGGRRYFGSFGGDLRIAFHWSWLILTAASVIILATPFIVDAAALGEVVGVCPAKAAGQPCSLCGMTPAFFLIADGQWTEARLANAGSVPLYIGLIVNVVVAAGRAARRGRWLRRIRRFSLGG